MSEADPTVVVCGHLVVDPSVREDYLSECAAVVTSALVTEGCRDFSMAPDPLDPARIRVLEVWSSRAAVEAFRGAGPEGPAAEAIRGGSMWEYDVSGSRRLI